MFDGQLNQGGKCTALNNNNISTSHNFDSIDGHFFQVTIKNVKKKFEPYLGLYAPHIKVFGYLHCLTDSMGLGEKLET